MKNIRIIHCCIWLLVISLVPLSAFAETKKTDKVIFNFIDVDLIAVTKFISDITGKNFIFDERMKGKITIIAPSKLSVDEAFNLFTAVLEIKGFTVISSGVDAYKIIPVADAKQKGIRIATDRQPVNESYVARLIPLKYISSDDALKFFQPIVSKDGHVSAFGPGNLLLVIDSGLNIEKIVSLVNSIDQHSDAQGKVNVYFLENADSTELSKVLEGVLKGIQTSKQQTAGVAAVKSFDGGITITADKATNSLVIVASPEDYQTLTQVIRQLDKRRKQVFVEAMIVEASIDKLRELGTRWRAIARRKGEPVLIGGVGTIDTGAINSIISGLSGLTIGGLGNFMTIPVTKPDGTTQNINVPGFAALFSLSDFQGAINVLSTPQILTSDNKEAEIVVGENVPFIGRRESDPTRTLSVFSTIERKDVGITLKITPQITEGDYVRLDMYQEISSVKQEPNADILISVGPTTTKRSTKTSVTVKDNQTVVIGGLMQEKDEDNITKVPILGDIPVLGWLFKYKTAGKTKTNLLVFLTPHIIKEAESLEKITSDKQKEFSRAEKQYAEAELLVKFQKEIPVEKVMEIILNKEASLIEFLKDLEIYRLKLKEGQTVEDAVKEFSDIPEVQYAEPNYKMKIK